METFEQYCFSKKIDAERFKSEDKKHFLYLENYFLQVHPDSFTAQKLFLINDLRRKYLLTDVSEKPIETNEPKGVLKPLIAKPSIKKLEIFEKEEIVEENSIQKSESPKPAISRPVMARPKMPASQVTDNSESITKPVLKPKISTQNTEDKPENTAVKPILRPKIPSKILPKTENENSSEEISKPKVSALRPKIPPKKS